jgi:hypothetical protein
MTSGCGLLGRRRARTGGGQGEDGDEGPERSVEHGGLLGFNKEA